MIFGMGGKRKELTLKQRAFALAMASGKIGPSACYAEAFDASRMKKSSIAAEAHKLANRPDLALMIKRERERIETREQASRVSLEAGEISRTKRDAATVLIKLREWLEGEGDPTPAMLKSAEMLGKASALFKEQSSVEVTNRDSASIEAALIEKLRELGVEDDNEDDNGDSELPVDGSVH